MPRTPLTDIEFEQQATNVISDQYGQAATTRKVGYVATQGLRPVMAHLGPAQVMVAVGGRKTEDQSIKDAALSKATAPYFARDVSMQEAFHLEYDRERHGSFNWGNLEADLRRFERLYDVAMTRLVVKVEDAALETFVSEFIDAAFETIGRDIRTDWVEPPFYVTFTSNTAPADTERREHLVEYTPDHYYQKRGSATGTEPGLSWSRHSTLDVASVQSKRAFLGSSDVVFREKVGMGQTVEYTPTDIEDELINTYATDQPRFGAVNSAALLDRVRDAVFDHDAFGIVDYDWEQNDGWAERGR